MSAYIEFLPSTYSAIKLNVAKETFHLKDPDRTDIRDSIDLRYEPC